MDFIHNFLISIMASIIGYFICKWLDRDNKRPLAKKIPMDQSSMGIRFVTL